MKPTRTIVAGAVAVGLVAVVAFVGHAETRGAAARKPDKKLTDAIEKIRPLHKKLGEPQPGDWLLTHPEAGQSFKEYLDCDPVVPTPGRRTICIQPLGEFTDKQREIVKLTAEFAGEFYGLPVRVEKDLPLSLIPDKARRVHPTWGDKQIQSTWVISDLLPERLPKDAFAYIAFTASDLWPGEGWNFVFGQASLRRRVGVWSIYRFGDPAKGDDEFRLCLLRTGKTAVHELGHMFSMQHCTAYECVMCGSNNMPESDRRPLEPCPECLAKLCWATGVDPIKRFGKLRQFCKAHGLAKELPFYERSLAALGAKPTSQPAEKK